MSTRRAAVLGKPIAHSLSPTLHTAAYRALGLHDWHYERHEVDENGLAAFLSSCDDTWAGLSLTMPLKHRVMDLVDQVDPLASVVGAVNTVLFTGPGGAFRVGANTDVYGIVAALRESAGLRVVESGLDQADQADQVDGVAVVLGAGATAASALAALGELGVTSPTVAVRSLARTATLRAAAHRMGIEPNFVQLSAATELMKTASYVISTLPAHAADGFAIELSQGSVRGVLLDVIYDPRPTALMNAWRNAGGMACGGERMLLHQAAEQVRLMTGLVAPLDEMDRALSEQL